LYKERSVGIGHKLGIGFFFITLLSSIIGIVSIYAIFELSQSTEKIHAHPHEISNATRNIQIEVMKIDAAMTNIVNESSSFIDHSSFYDANESATAFDIKVAISKIDRAEHNVLREFEIIFEKYLGDKKDIDNALNIFVAWKPIRDKVIHLLQANKTKEAKKIMQDVGVNYNEKIYDSVYDMMSFADTTAENFIHNAIEKKSEILFFLITFILLVILGSITTALIIIKDITVPLKALLDVTNTISNGDLDVSHNKEIQALLQRDDEIGTLVKSFEKMVNVFVTPYSNIIKSKRNLKEKTDELRRLLDSFDEHVIASKTDRAGRIIYVSKAFSKASGYTKEELLGEMQSIVRHPDTPEKVHEALWNTVQSGKAWHGELKNKTKDGGYFYIDAHISPDINSKGKTIGFNAINQDITAKKRLEELFLTLEKRVTEEIAKNKQQASHMLQQSRLAQMGEMISMIAHQWRQPLASISAISGTLNLDVMMDDYNKEFFQERLEAIDELAHHLSSTINDFRDFFKDGKEEEKSSLTEIVDSSLKIIMPSFSNNNITLDNDTKENVTLMTFPNEVKQVLLNLLKNSEEAMEEKKVDQGKVWIKGFVQDNQAVIRVEDNAGGIPDGVIGKVFDPYFSTKTKKDGTGLGLYMSKTIIEEHCKGRLALKNGDKGAIFTITLPLEAT